MSTDKEPCCLLPWDTAFFARRVARVCENVLTEQTAAAIEAWVRANQIDTLYLLASPNDDETVRIAERSGFHLVDIRVTLARHVGSLHEDPVSGDIRQSQPADIEALLAIAGASHTETRFTVDPDFGPEWGRRLYREWMIRSCHGWADRVLVATERDVVTGYITCHEERDEPLGRIGLLAVAEAFRGQGWAHRLISASLNWFCASKCRTVSVVTQGRNAVAQRQYQRCGFTTASTMLWYHWHRRGPK